MCTTKFRDTHRTISTWVRVRRVTAEGQPAARFDHLSAMDDEGDLCVLSGVDAEGKLLRNMWRLRFALLHTSTQVPPQQAGQPAGVRQPGGGRQNGAAAAGDDGAPPEAAATATAAAATASAATVPAADAKAEAPAAEPDGLSHPAARAGAAGQLLPHGNACSSSSEASLASLT